MGGKGEECRTFFFIFIFYFLKPSNFFSRPPYTRSFSPLFLGGGGETNIMCELPFYDGRSGGCMYNMYMYIYVYPWLSGNEEGEGDSWFSFRFPAALPSPPHPTPPHPSPRSRGPPCALAKFAKEEHVSKKLSAPGTNSFLPTIPAPTPASQKKKKTCP